MDLDQSRIDELVTETEWSIAWPILHSLKPDLLHDVLLANRKRLQNDGYRLFGLRIEGQMVTAAGIAIAPHLTWGRGLRIIDLATSPNERSKGYGQTMLNYLEEFARESECTKIILHSRTERVGAHRFYTSKGKFKEHANVFVKTL